MTENNSQNDRNKIIPEWKVNSDDQVIWLGIGVAAILLVPMVWAFISNGNEDTELLAANTSSKLETEETINPLSNILLSPNSSISGFLDVESIAKKQPGDVSANRDGNKVILTGYVANEKESKEAENQIMELSDVSEVDNQLVLLEPLVLSKLKQTKTTNPQVSGVGTTITILGTVGSNEEKSAAYRKATEVTKATIVDKINVNVIDAVNTLPQVKFATGSAEILPESYPNLDKAANLLKNIKSRIEIQGYTDTVGDDNLNLQLSQSRAEAVKNYLVNKGVKQNLVTAKGFGETNKFAKGETPEDYAENRKVLFKEIK